MPERKYAAARSQQSKVNSPSPRRVAAKKAVAKKTEPRATGRARALSNPGASKRSARATEMLKKNRPAIKKMMEARRKRGK